MERAATARIRVHAMARRRADHLLTVEKYSHTAPGYPELAPRIQFAAMPPPRHRRPFQMGRTSVHHGPTSKPAAAHPL